MTRRLPSSSPAFKRINFGYASAEKESAESPDLLIRGYFDLHDACSNAADGPDFLFLGYKGSGKSAIGERLRLINEGRHDVFINSIYLEDFPFTTFSKIIRGADEPESKYPTAWSWLLLIYLIDSFGKDAALRVPDPAAFQETLTALRHMGFAPHPNLRHVVNASSKKTFKLAIPNFFEHSWETGPSEKASEIPYFVEGLRRLVDGARSESTHYIIVDGLDDILTKRDIQYRSLGSLIFEVNRLNNRFKQNHVPAKILLLCRTDLFEKVAGANKNKIRQDSAIDLDWYANPREPGESMLIRIVNIRSQLSLHEQIDVFEEFFPREIDNRPTWTYLLDMTRHTPRDFLQLMACIQLFCKGNMLNRPEILAGCRHYSINYLLPEMIDELEGYFSADEVSEILKLFGSMRSRDFELQQFMTHCKTHSILTEERIIELVEALFESSGLGNIQGRREEGTYFTFRYRNRHSSFNTRERVILHRGLWKALNLI